MIDNFRKQIANQRWDIINNKPNLVITVGDSWTFGDSLGTIIIDHDKDDMLARKEQVYGRHISDALDADWINYGIPGGSNRDSTESLELILRNYYNKYEKIYVFITMTEVGRGGSSGWYEFTDKSRDTNTLLKQYEQLEFDKINELLACFNNIKLICSRTFTSSYPETNTHDLHMVQDNWITLNFKCLDEKRYTLNDIQRTGGVTMMVHSGVTGNNKHLLETPKNLANYKDYFIKQYDDTRKLCGWLNNNKLHHNIATCHPTKESHKLWADYLLANITN